MTMPLPFMLMLTASVLFIIANNLVEDHVKSVGWRYAVHTLLLLSAGTLIGLSIAL